MTVHEIPLDGHARRAAAHPGADGLPAQARRWSALGHASVVRSSARVARTRAELAEIGRLRFQRFVVDQWREPSDHCDARLIDPIDSLSVNLYARRDGTIAVALRMTWAADVVPSDDLSPLTAALDPSSRFGPTIICSRLVAGGRGADLVKLVALLRRAYEVALLSGARLSVLSTPVRHINLLARLGYRVPGSVATEPVAGPQRPMILDLHDLAHLEDVGSPLLAVAKRLLRPSSLPARRPVATSLDCLMPAACA